MTIATLSGEEIQQQMTDMDSGHRLVCVGGKDYGLGESEEEERGEDGNKKKTDLQLTSGRAKDALSQQ